MKLYEKNIIYIIAMIYSIHLCADTGPTQFPPLIGQDMTCHYYLQKGQESQLLNIQLDAYGTTNATTSNHGWRSFFLMNSSQNVPLISRSIATALVNLQAEDWQNGIYLVPYMLDQKGSFVTDFKQFAEGGHGVYMYMGVYDHQFNLLAHDNISSLPNSSVQWQNGWPVTMNWLPGSYDLKFTGVQPIAKEISWPGCIYFIQFVDQVPQPTVGVPHQTSMYSLPGVGTVNIGAISLPKGKLSKLEFRPTFGVAGYGKLPLSTLSSTSMTALSTALGSGSVSIDVNLEQNSSKGYNVTMMAYQNGVALFDAPVALTQTGQSLLNENGTMIPSSSAMTTLEVKYQTDGMNTEGSASLGGISKFVIVSTEDTISSGKMLAAGETLTQLDTGFVFRMGYTQYTAIIPVPTQYITNINTELTKGVDVAFSMSLEKGSTNYGVNMSAQAGGKQLFSHSVKDMPVVDSTTNKSATMPISATLVGENIGYQTSNMTKGELVPNSTTYSFMSNKNASIMDLSGIQAPTTGGNNNPANNNPAKNPPAKNTGGGGGHSFHGRF